MFATLLGGLPRPTAVGGAPIADDDAAVAAALDAQAAAGLEPLTDGRLRPTPVAAALTDVEEATSRTLAAWKFAADHAAGLVKQALPGPYSLGRRAVAAGRAKGRDDDPRAAAAADAAAADAVALAFAAAVRRHVLALAEAGCAFVEIEEPDAHLIGTDPVERARFARAHLALLDGVDGVHLSLSIVGGNADKAGIETILAAPYPSLAVDLINGPDNWRLVRAAPGDRGIVCGAMTTRPGGDDGPEVLLWAAAYAASGNGRGGDRVGLGTAGSLERLSWPEAVHRMERLGIAARLAASPRSEVADHVDPRSVDIRSAALGRRAGPPKPPRQARPGS